MGSRDKKVPDLDASEPSWILRKRDNGLGQWLLAAYRSGILAGLVVGIWTLAQVWGDFRDISSLNLAESLTRIEIQQVDMVQRLESIETWISDENNSRRPRLP